MRDESLMADAHTASRPLGLCVVEESFLVPRESLEAGRDVHRSIARPRFLRADVAITDKFAESASEEYKR